VDSEASKGKLCGPIQVAETVEKDTRYVEQFLRCWDSLENFRTKSSAARPAEHGRQTRSHSRRASPAHPG